MTDKIILSVIPKEESLTGQSAEMPGFDTFTFGSGANQATINLPRVASRTLVTKMLLESGETAVIGGLLFETEAETVRKLPFLGDIPFLGWLFRAETTNVVKENLVVFITPTIVRSGKETRDLMREQIEEGYQDLEDEFPTLFNPKISPDWSYADRLLPDSWVGDDDGGSSGDASDSEAEGGSSVEIVEDGSSYDESDSGSD